MSSDEARPPEPASVSGAVAAWRRWWDDPLDRFGMVLVFVVLTLVVSALVDVGDSWSLALVTGGTSAVAVVAAIRAVGLSGAARRVLHVLVVVVLSTNVVLALVQQIGDVALPSVGVGRGVVWLAVALVVPVLIIRRILAHRVVAMRTVVGAVVAYLHIAFAYSVLFQFVEGWTDAPFFGQPEPSTTFTYVSLTTISTLGLGDLSPAGDLPRLVLASEAVLGQIFLVTVVAVVVSRFAGSGDARN